MTGDVPEEHWSDEAKMERERLEKVEAEASRVLGVCIWKRTDIARHAQDEDRKDADYWENPHGDDHWWPDGIVDDFEYCPYCGKKIKREKMR